jgi:hypothetical protein
MEEKKFALSTVRRIRTALVLAGTIIGYAALFIPDVVVSYSLVAVSLCLSVYGCHLWARLKGRSELWMFMGLLAPLGFLALALFKDRSQQPPPS